MAKLNRQNVPFTQVANEVLNDKDLSWKAKGIYAYLFSKPDNWDFSAHRIKMDSANGRDSVLSALKELEQKGYLERKKLGNGRVEYYLKFNLQQNPDTENPTLASEPGTEKPTVGKAHGGKSRTISNKEVIVIKNTSNTSEETSRIPLVIEMFKVVNPSIANLYGNKTQRAACERLLKIHGFEKLGKIISFLPKSNITDYMPVVTTPVQLESKMGQLVASWQKLKNKQPVVL